MVAAPSQYSHKYSLATAVCHSRNPSFLWYGNYYKKSLCSVPDVAKGVCGCRIQSLV